MFIVIFISQSIIFRLASNLKLRLILPNVLILILITKSWTKQEAFSDIVSLSHNIPHRLSKSSIWKIHPAPSTKNSPSSTPSPHYPQPQKNINRFDRQRSRSAEQIGNILYQIVRLDKFDQAHPPQTKNKKKLSWKSAKNRP